MTQTAIEQALDTWRQFNVEPTSLVTYRGGSQVLVICDEDMLETALALKNHPRLKFNFIVISHAMTIEASGFLGDFVVSVDDGQQKHHHKGDMLLDLFNKPLINLAMPPAGYLHHPWREGDHVAINQQLQDMIGEFDKPRYYDYHPELCAHGSNGKTVCTRCIDVCPAGAISSLVDKVEVDSHLCQGGGTCATVCPSGAMQYRYPSLVDTGNRIRLMLNCYREAGGERPVLLFHTEGSSPEPWEGFESRLLPVLVEELGSVGMDVILSSVSYGASQIILFVDEDVPALTLQVLQQQQDIVREILDALELDPDVVQLVESGDQPEPLASEVVIAPAEHAMPRQKRDAILIAVDYLYKHRNIQTEMIPLPPVGAAFGTVIVDENLCTLCFSCVSACPGSALQDGSGMELPQLGFIESRCIQCGTCTLTCPEVAIRIKPRLMLNREKRNQTRVLHQDQTFSCVSCGKPFATQSVINKMLGALSGHHMFQGERAMNRLKMCEDCRVADIVQDPEAMSGQFGQKNNGLL